MINETIFNKVIASTQAVKGSYTHMSIKEFFNEVLSPETHQELEKELQVVSKSFKLFFYETLDFSLSNKAGV